MNEQDQDQIDRRSMLLGAGTAAAAGVVAAFGSEPVQAQGKVDQECMTIVYQSGPDVRFDFNYYINTHMPRIMNLYGKSISRFELRRGMSRRSRSGSPTAPRSTRPKRNTKPACAPTCRSSRTRR
jgi:hypothetical protein